MDTLSARLTRALWGDEGEGLGKEKSKFLVTGMKEGDISRDPVDIIKMTAGV